VTAGSGVSGAASPKSTQRERALAHLARRLVKAEPRAELLFAHGARQVNLVAQDQKRRCRQLLHVEQVLHVLICTRPTVQF